MSQAIALVNRMRAKRRDATSTVLTDKTGVAYLDQLNTAITTVLETRTWDFQKRSNGQITTVPSFSGDSFLATQGSIAVLFSNYSGTDSTLTGQFVTRIVAPGDQAYGNTAFRIENAALGGGFVTANLEDAWPGTAPSSNWNTYTWEYLLPSTVREVLSVKNTENEQDLIFSNEPEQFEREFPRPWDELSTQPEIVVVGGEIRNTIVSGAQGQDYGLALRVWPVPEAAYQLDYSYVFRQPRLTVDTDNLERVPPAVEDLIVDLAVARVISELEKDLQTGMALEAKVLKQMEMLHRNHFPAAGKRPEMLSHDRTSPRQNALMWLPRTVQGL